MQKAVAEANERARQEFEAAVQSGRTHHLGDAFWRERERGLDCCYDCAPNHPDLLLADAQDEIRAYKETL